MRVLFVTHNVPRVAGDAAGSFVLRLAVALRDAGVQVAVIAPGAPGLPERDVVEGIPIQRVRYAPDAAMTLAYTGQMVEDVRRSWTARLALVNLLRALRLATQRAVTDADRAGEPFDVVHAHWWFPAGLALWGALSRGSSTRHAPTMVVTMHGSDVRLAQTLAPARALMRAVLDAFQARTVVSSWLAAAVERSAPGRSVVVAPMPIDTRWFTPPESPDRVGMLFVGRLNAQKGIADLITALAEPIFAAPALATIPLHVVGDGPERDAMQALAVQRGVSGRVHWLGALPQAALVPLYQRAAVVVMPSREEGLGLVAVEAQMCGAPVVAYASGGLVDVVREDAGGTLVPEGDVPGLATAIGQLLVDPGAASSKAAAAHAAVRDRFSPASVAQRYLTIYREAIRKGRGPTESMPPGTHAR